MLIDLYGRTGRYQDALRTLDDSLRIHPGRVVPVNERALFAAWAKHGDQSVADIRPSTFHGSVSRDGIVLPVLIHGKTAHWALDTGANVSLISEKEAAMFGVVVDDSSASVTDGAGGAAKVRTAVIDELTFHRRREAAQCRFPRLARFPGAHEQHAAGQAWPHWNLGSSSVAIPGLEIQRNISDWRRRSQRETSRRQSLPRWHDSRHARALRR